jgi:hypothetical protein
MFACFQPNSWVQPASAISPQEASCWKPEKTDLGGGRCVLSVFSTQKLRSALPKPRRLNKDRRQNPKKPIDGNMNRNSL